MHFVSFDLPFTKKSFQMRVGWMHPIWLILLLVFIIPHDPSSVRLEPHTVGSAAYSLSPRASTRVQQPVTTATFARATPAAMVATSPLIAAEHEGSDMAALRRLLRLARARPQLVTRVALAALIPARAGEDEDSAQLAVNGSSWSTSVQLLRSAYGEGRDLTPAETRALYHALLPTSLLEDEADEISLAERAEIAIAARRAARLYARERTLLPYAIGSELFDGVRQLLKAGSFRRSGYSDDQIWFKYAGALPSDLPEGAAFPDDVYYTILQKACSSNSVVDKLCGQVSHHAHQWSDAANELSQGV